MGRSLATRIDDRDIIWLAGAGCERVAVIAVASSARFTFVPSTYNADQFAASLHKVGGLIH